MVVAAANGRDVALGDVHHGREVVGVRAVFLICQRVVDRHSSHIGVSDRDDKTTLSDVEGFPTFRAGIGVKKGGKTMRNGEHCCHQACTEKNL